MVLPSDELALADIIRQIFQLILGVHIVGQDGFLQILEEISAYNRLFEVDIVAKPGLVGIKGKVSLIVKGKEFYGEIGKRKEVFAE